MKRILPAVNGLIIAILPFVFLMCVILSVFNPWFLLFEYTRPGFPQDEYGFTGEERLEYGVKALQYVTILPEISLADLHTVNDAQLFNESEITHMADVRAVFQTARWSFVAAIALVFFALALVLRKPKELHQLICALKTGAIAALITYCAVVLLALTAFDTLFYYFHQLFFAEGSWLFYVDDALIRLFPKQLWIDAFVIVGITAVILALLSLLIFRKLEMRVRCFR